jgi:hypothetical protein
MLSHCQFSAPLLLLSNLGLSQDFLQQHHSICDIPSFDESILAWVNDFLHIKFRPDRQGFCENFEGNIEQKNWSILMNNICIIIFRK